MITLLRPRPGLVLALVLSAALLSAGAPPATAVDGLGDPVFPSLGNTGYRALAYDLSFEYRADTRTVDATAVITARPSRTLTSLSLDALGLDVRSVRVDGRAAAFTTRDEKLTVTPAKPLHGDATARLTVEYTADPRAGLPHTGWVPTPDGFAVAGQPTAAHTVFPCNDHPGDKARFTIAVTAPDNLLGVANGELTETERLGDGRTLRRYVSREPVATELVQVSVGDYTVRERTGPHGLPLRDVVPTARAAELEPALNLTADQLAWAERRLGPFPFETYGLMPVNTDDPAAFAFTGLETQTLTLYKPTFLRQAEPAIGSHMMHELVHSWFGDSVTPATWADLWLNEGHAEYYGFDYRDERGWPDTMGHTTLVDRMRHVYGLGDQWRHDAGPVASPTAAKLFDDQRYAGGALVLFALREKVGADTFDRIERTFLSEHRHGNASTRDYVRTASEVSGQDLSGFLADWLYGLRTPPMPGHPDWTVAPASSTPAPVAGAL
ncbi:M1 family metallopeptidase [Streptomyces sp. FH025]|uniref:M1 family metallopeptidase n=1 Tax=Streptomyces sp. FH025 TaxID=2815937 RepID=UPI001A9F45B2|nr:M1 family metallopeptidase [Streptomyces sp. FH025]MBO1418233.1 M1 family metallopeptidase [Streptomyces sp. FH025]